MPNPDPVPDRANTCVSSAIPPLTFCEREESTPSFQGPTHAGLVRLEDLFMFVGAIHYPGGGVFKDSIGVMLSLHLHLTVTGVQKEKKSLRA